MAAMSELATLVDRLEDARRRLEEQASDPSAAAAILGELNDLAQRLSTEVERERRLLTAVDDADESQLGLL